MDDITIAKLDRGFRLMLYASIGWTIGAALGKASRAPRVAGAVEGAAPARPRRHTAVSAVRKAEPHFTLDDAQRLADERGEQVVYFDGRGYFECYPRPKPPTRSDPAAGDVDAQDAARWAYP